MRSEDVFDEVGHVGAPRTLEELARACGVHLGTLRAWKRQGLRLVPGPDGAYSVGAVMAWRRRKPLCPDPRTGSLWGRERRRRRKF
jgi:hypothetical protein